MQVKGLFSRPNVSVGPPKHAAQEAFSVIITPASTKTSHTDVAIREPVRSEDVMIRNDYDLLRIPDLRPLTKFTLENADASRTTNVVGQKNVGIDPNIFSSCDLTSAGTASQDFLSERHRSLNGELGRRLNQVEKP